MSVKQFLAGMFLSLMLLLGTAQLASAQNVTLNFDRTPLKTVLNEIQKQVDYTFVYNDQQIGANKVVSLQASKVFFGSLQSMHFTAVAMQRRRIALSMTGSLSMTSFRFAYSFSRDWMNFSASMPSMTADERCQ